MSNYCYKQKVAHNQNLRCPLCFRKLKDNEHYYRYSVFSWNLRIKFRKYFPKISHSSSFVCEECYPKLPEELRKIIEGRNYEWELDLDQGFWLNKETKEREYF